MLAAVMAIQRKLDDVLGRALDLAKTFHFNWIASCYLHLSETPRRVGYPRTVWLTGKLILRPLFESGRVAMIVVARSWVIRARLRLCWLYGKRRCDVRDDHDAPGTAAPLAS
jgi:hypothetical protein